MVLKLLNMIFGAKVPELPALLPRESKLEWSLICSSEKELDNSCWPCMFVEFKQMHAVYGKQKISSNCLSKFSGLKGTFTGKVWTRGFVL